MRCSLNSRVNPSRWLTRDQVVEICLFSTSICLNVFDIGMDVRQAIAFTILYLDGTTPNDTKPWLDRPVLTALLTKSYFLHVCISWTWIVLSATCQVFVAIYTTKQYKGNWWSWHAAICSVLLATPVALNVQGIVYVLRNKELDKPKLSELKLLRNRFAVMEVIIESFPQMLTQSTLLYFAQWGNGDLKGNLTILGSTLALIWGLLTWCRGNGRHSFLSSYDMELTELPASVAVFVGCWLTSGMMAATLQFVFLYDVIALLYLVSETTYWLPFMMSFTINCLAWTYMMMLVVLTKRWQKKVRFKL